MKPNVTVQIFSSLLMGLIVLAMVFEPWNRMVDQLDTRLRRTFFGLEKSISIEHEVMKTMSFNLDDVGFSSVSSKELMNRMPDLQELVFEISERLAARINRTLCRISSVLALFPVVILMLATPLMDGILGRRIKQVRFDYPSPLLHRCAIFLLSALLAIFTLLIITPIPFAPQETILMSLLSGLVLKQYLLHLPKRL
ncbi:MAG: DUF4400 domain-containing protein [Gammaproteobacteria bacterium]|nr:DUF4400 domain-containing protein [Gammaproteobacteria bacterium]NBT43314.1 DUF4400 domain-containing protein [Gammaproteobacteria bacterium]NBY21376.1 DUF4400 domain-containing protein [Gammaproteobacteria bacterium]